MYVYTYTTKHLCNTVEKGHQIHHRVVVYCCQIPSIHQHYCSTTIYLIYKLTIIYLSTGKWEFTVWEFTAWLEVEWCNGKPCNLSKHHIHYYTFLVSIYLVRVLEVASYMPFPAESLPTKETSSLAEHRLSVDSLSPLNSSIFRSLRNWVDWATCIVLLADFYHMLHWTRHRESWDNEVQLHCCSLTGVVISFQSINDAHLYEAWCACTLLVL